MLGITVRFAQGRYNGSEASQSVIVTLELAGGTSLYPFNVTIAPSEQSPVSAKGNNILCQNVLIELF